MKGIALNSLVVCLICAVSLASVAHGEEGGLGVFVWPSTGRDEGAAKQIETLTGAVLGKAKKGKRASYSPALDQETQLEAFRAALKEAGDFLRGDLQGRHNRTLQEKAMNAYLHMGRILDVVEAADVGELYRVLTVATFRGGDEHMAAQYFSAYRHVGKNPGRFENVYRDVAAYGEEEGESASVALEGSLRIVSNPEGGSVQLNGEVVGLTPLTLRRPPGLHHVVVSHTGHYPQGRMVEVVSESEQEERFSLPPHKGFQRYQKALRTLRKLLAKGKVAKATPYVKDMLSLLEAEGLLVLVVSDQKKKGIRIRGLYASPQGAFRTIDGLLKRDASLLDAFEKLLLEAMKKLPTPSPEK